jgi:hypothetical protein
VSNQPNVSPLFDEVNKKALEYQAASGTKRQELFEELVNLIRTQANYLVWQSLHQERADTLVPKEFVFSSLELPYLTARLMADERGRAFLNSRGISEEVARSLQLGLTTKTLSPGAKSQLALCIPRFDDQGKLLGVKYRALDPHDKGSKWLQEPGSTADFLLVPMPAKTDVLFIFEGELDCALALSLGVDAAAYFGTAGVPNGHPSARFLTSVAAIKSRGQRIIIVPDADKVGELWKRDPEAAKEWLSIVSKPADPFETDGVLVSNKRIESEFSENATKS